MQICICKPKICIFAALNYFKCMKQEIAKFLLDVAKLLVGGILLTGIMRQDIPPLLLFVVGGSVTAVFIAAAFVLLWWNSKSVKLIKK